MDPSGKEAVQSFLLRFWHEPSCLVPSHWRETIWHEQDLERRQQSVDGPEKVFEIVRKELSGSIPLRASTTASPGKLAVSRNERSISFRRWSVTWTAVAGFLQRHLPRRWR
jgi:hypothetical protein